MGCAEVGGHLGLSISTAGYAMSTPSQGAAISSRGYVPVPLSDVWMADITITPVQPVDSATEVSRSARWIMQITDPNVCLEMGTLKVMYRQQPYPAQSADGWEIVFLGADRAEVTAENPAGFQAGWANATSDISIEDYSGTGERATIAAQPNFGLLPGSTGTLRVEIWDCDGNIAVETWTFTVAESASTVNLREEIRRLSLAADRYEWDDLLVANSTYTYDVDFSGGQIEVIVNESLVADIGDQIGQSAYGLDILNYTRRYKLLSKLTEYPRDVTEPDATFPTAALLYDGQVDNTDASGFLLTTSPVFADRRLPEDQFKATYTEGNRTEREWRYYTVFLLVPPTEESPDWRWAYSDPSTFVNAFAYGQYGHAGKLYDLMPEAWKTADGGEV